MAMIMEAPEMWQSGANPFFIPKTPTLESAQEPRCLPLSLNERMGQPMLCSRYMLQ